jgi:hypothetical protein
VAVAVVAAIALYAVSRSPRFYTRDSKVTITVDNVMAPNARAYRIEGCLAVRSLQRGKSIRSALAGHVTVD